MVSAFPVARNVHAEESDKKEQLTIQGIVVDEHDKPAANVRVLINWSDLFDGDTKNIQATTDTEGKFTLTGDISRFRGQVLQASAPGPLMAQLRLPWRDIEKDPSLDTLKLKLKPSQRLILEVVDAAGKPITNARTGVVADHRLRGTGLTDQEGKITYDLPQDAQIQNVCAISEGHGLDYQSYELPRGQSGDQLTKLPAIPDHPIRLILDGNQPLQVKVQETDGTPIAGVDVSPWLLQKKGQNRGLNLSYYRKLVSAQTDKQGKIEISWIPRWQKDQIIIWPRDKEYVHQRALYDPQKGDGKLTVELVKLVPLSGQVTLPDGSPAIGMAISATGENYELDTFRQTVHTDEQGRYLIKAAPNNVYLLTAGNQKWASAPHTGFALWPGKPISNLDFQLRPATRIFGRVTVGSRQEPVKGQYMAVYHYGQDVHNMKDVELPNPDKSRRWVQPTIVHSTTTDTNGEYELFVGSGKFDIRGPSQNPIQKFEITDEPEKKFDFHAARPEKGMLTGNIVTGNPPRPVPEATVHGIYRYQLAGHDLQANTEQSGKFKVERELHPVVIYARSKDKQLAGIVEIGPDTDAVTIPLQPLGTVRGQLVDETTEAPFSEREVSYGIRVHLGGRSNPFRTGFGGKTFTDKQGHFEINDLVLGQEYNISLVNRPKDQPNQISWRPIEKVKPESTQPIELGKLEVSPPRPPYVPPTLAERIAAAFNVKGTPLERFARGKQIVRLVMQRPIVLFGDPESDSVQQLMKLRYEDGDVRTALFPFLVIAIDSSGEKSAAANALAKELGVKLNHDSPDFDLFVTDEAGKQLAQSGWVALSADGKVSKEKLLAFLKTHTLPPYDARELLDTALKQAKQENKRILVQETATWCGPCRLLSQFLDREREQWQRDYIWIKMDHRWTGADKIMKTMRGGAQGGIPWWAILDQDGNVMATSNNQAGENIGFPSTRSDLAHVRDMLEKTAIRLTPMDVNTLVEALKQKD
ncbi:hypothetical protein [Gimesia sp.]|uniref:hypothetical protein n=1 Tax=Gimesia sp. TaxID=2024833 RepID=UPI003A90B8C0